MTKNRMDLVYNAVNNNDLLQLQEVLLEHPELDVNQPLIGSMTALHVAAEKGYSSCIMVLMSAGADVDITDEFGYTPLMNGIIAGYPLVVKKLLLTGVGVARCRVDQMSHHGLTALHMAVKKGSFHVVNMLLRAGANPCLRTRDNLSALAIAMQNRDTAVIKALLLGCRYVDPNVLLNRTERPFYNALMAGDFELAKVLALSGYSALGETLQYLKQLKAEWRVGQSERRRIFHQRLPLGNNTDIHNHAQNQTQNHHAPNNRSAHTVGSLSLCKSHQLAQQQPPESLSAILPLTLQPLRLEHSCRLRIRKSLSFSVPVKVTGTCLPSVIQDYICFRDVYQEPLEQTDPG